jgi:inosose dehydratase
MTDRRRFLGLAPAALAGLSGLPALLDAAAAENDPFGGFILGIQSYTFRNFGLEQALRRTQELGLQSVELSRGHAPLTDDPAKLAAIGRLCKEYRVTPRTWGVQYFTKNHDANRKSFEFGKALGV